MPLRLPTDTQHIRLRTRQYELFGRSLGQGIDRRTLLAVGVAVLTWWAILLLLGVPVVSRYSPLLYLVPPIATMINGTRQDRTGRMVLASWRDWARSRLPARRRRLINPLLPARRDELAPLRLAVTTHLEHVRNREVR